MGRWRLIRTMFVAFAAFASAATPVLAHDFWIQPQSFAAPVAAEVPLTIFVGHAEFRQRWGVAAGRMVRFDDIAAYGKRSRMAEVHTDRGAEDARLAFAKPGVHMLVMESTHAFSDLPSIRYNDFIKVEGLTAAIAWRASHNLDDSPGREMYSRRAKALLQIGTGVDADAFMTRPVGLTLEIVPLHNPYTLAPGEALPVQVLYNGKPLAGALVKLTNLDFDAHPIAAKRSDADGKVSFSVPRQGKWLVNTIWSVPISGDPRADFDTTFSSLTFGYPVARP